MSSKKPDYSMLEQLKHRYPVHTKADKAVLKSVLLTGSLKLCICR